MMFIRTPVFLNRVTPDIFSQLVGSENENIIWCNLDVIKFLKSPLGEMQMVLL